MRRVARYPLKPLLARAAGRELRRRARALSEVEEWVELAQDFNYAGIRIAPWQKGGEIASLLKMVQAEQPRRVLEIGTARGGTLFLFACVARPDALLVSVDLRHGSFGGGYAPWRIPLYRLFARAQQRVQLVAGDSHETTTVKRVAATFGGDAVDFLFIDGDHTYEGVRKDFLEYAPFVRRGGLIALHDIVPAAPGDHVDSGGVPVLWQELKGAYPNAIELVEDAAWGGIGVVRSSGSAQPLPAWIRPPVAR